MAKLNDRDIQDALKQEDLDEAVDNELINLKVNRENLSGGRVTNKTTEGLAKKDDQRVYGKFNPK